MPIAIRDRPQVMKQETQNEQKRGINMQMRLQIQKRILYCDHCQNKIIGKGRKGETLFFYTYL